MRQQHRGHVGVVLNEAAFGDVPLGPERLAKIRQPYLAALDLQDHVVGIGGDLDGAESSVHQAPDHADQPARQEERHRSDDDKQCHETDDEHPVARRRPLLVGVTSSSARLRSLAFHAKSNRSPATGSIPTSASIATLKIIRSWTTRGIPRSRLCQSRAIAKSGDVRSPRPGTRPSSGSSPTRMFVPGRTNAESRRREMCFRALRRWTWPSLSGRNRGARSRTSWILGLQPPLEQQGTHRESRADRNHQQGVVTLEPLESTASLSARGIVAAVVLPNFSMLMTTFSSGTPISPLPTE